MSAVTISEASIFDVVELAGGRGHVVWQVLQEMWMKGQCFAFRDAEGRLLAVAGLYPFEAGAAEAWFTFTAAAAASMRGIVRCTRLTLEAQPYRRIICNCISRQGAHFARLAGFEFRATRQQGELWEWVTSSTC